MQLQLLLKIFKTDLAGGTSYKIMIFVRNIIYEIKSWREIKSLRRYFVNIAIQQSCMKKI